MKINYSGMDLVRRLVWPDDKENEPVNGEPDENLISVEPGDMPVDEPDGDGSDTRTIR